MKFLCCTELRDACLKLASRIILSGILSLTACASLSPLEIKSSERSLPEIGAIRWDGWFGGSKWAKNLEPAEYHDRLPFYTTWKGGKPVVNSDDQAVMDAEIVLASNAGLNYWAFVYYHQDNTGTELYAYNYGLRRYLASSLQAKLNFCLNLQGPHLGRKDDWPKTADVLVDIFRRPTYQRVLGNRPLVYLFYVEEFLARFGSIENVQEAIIYLRRQSEAAGLGSPYIVAQAPADKAAGYIDQLGLDACGAYAVASDGAHLERRHYPFHDLMEINAAFWERCKATGKEVVPIVTVGWDVRPRWLDADLMKQYRGGERPYYIPPTPSELRQYINMAIDWTMANPKHAKAQAILIYSWNESDEGGWLVPTLSEGNKRLEAIRSALESPRNYAPPHRLY